MNKSERDKLREWADRHANDGTSPVCIAGRYAIELLDYCDRLEDALKAIATEDDGDTANPIALKALEGSGE